MDVLLGIEPYHLWKDENDHSKGDWKDGVPLQPSYEQQDEIFQRFIERYPNLKCIARHVRYAHSGSGWRPTSRWQSCSWLGSG